MARVGFEPRSPEGNRTTVLFCLVYLSFLICQGHFLIGAKSDLWSDLWENAELQGCLLCCGFLGACAAPQGVIDNLLTPWTVSCFLLTWKTSLHKTLNKRLKQTAACLHWFPPHTDTHTHSHTHTLTHSEHFLLSFPSSLVLEGHEWPPAAPGPYPPPQLPLKGLVQCVQKHCFLLSFKFTPFSKLLSGSTTSWRGLFCILESCE